MLRSVKEIYDYVLKAQDGEIGRCKDFLFDDEYWTIRFMVADTGKWLPGFKVVISPIALEKPDWTARSLPIRLTKEQIENAPGIDEAKPVSRQYESKYYRYYGWPYYWAGTYAWGAEATPEALYNVHVQGEAQKEDVANDDHLRSTDEVTGYHIKTLADKIGHVEDFIVDDETWTIRYIVVDTKNWLPGKKVLVSPDWIKNIEWAEAEVEVELTKEQLENSPEYDPTEPINREYEARLYDYYGKPIYWTE